MKPTNEQLRILDLFKTGDTLAVEAGAGTGKTTALRLLAESAPRRRGVYVAFNKAIVTDASQTMPGYVRCHTAHALAFRYIGKNYAHRLKSGRMRSSEIAWKLGLTPFIIRYGKQTKVLQDGYLAGLVMRSVTRFCQTTDLEPGTRHVTYVDGIDLPNPDGSRTYENNNELARHILPAMLKAWEDFQDLEGVLPYRHDHYLKAWQMSEPKIAADYILFDEAQDANPVILSVVVAQKHAQLVFVGDQNQAIYEFTGAINALASLPPGSRSFLTRSFRFGPEIAEVANEILEMLESELRLTGHNITSTVGAIAEPDAILTRTNATAVSTLLALQQQGQRPHLVGGGSDVLAFAKAAADLKEERKTFHPELACFDNWGEVQTYVEQDAQGSELKLLVSLVDTYGVETIVAALEKMPDEPSADVIISTAHKAKGREWNAVQLAGDFPDEIAESPQEMRLLYVAATRGKRELDVQQTCLSRDLPEIDEDDNLVEEIVSS